MDQNSYNNQKHLRKRIEDQANQRKREFNRPLPIEVSLADLATLIK